MCSSSIPVSTPRRFQPLTLRFDCHTIDSGDLPAVDFVDCMWDRGFCLETLRSQTTCRGYECNCVVRRGFVVLSLDVRTGVSLMI